jgi:hypothetical protein
LTSIPSSCFTFSCTHYILQGHCFSLSSSSTHWFAQSHLFSQSLYTWKQCHL